MKKYLLILAGVAFFSLFTSNNVFATDDTLPDENNTHITLDSKDGFTRQAAFDNNTGLLLSCKRDFTGTISTFPLGDYTQNGITHYSTTPCGYTVSSGVLAGPYDMSPNFRNIYYMNNNGRTVSNATWLNYIKSALSQPTIYRSSDYVSAFHSFTNNYNFNNPSHSGRLTVPLSTENGYSIYGFTITNATDYATTVIAPLITASKIHVDSGNKTPDEIASVINGTATVGWVWTDPDNGTKQTTLRYCDTSDNCIRIIPENEEFAAIEDYLKLLPDFTYFTLYAIPLYTDVGYTITDLTFSTPDNLTAYGVNFERLNNEAYWGMPMLYSLPYPSTSSINNPLDPLYTDMFDIRASSFYLMPSTPEAFERSRQFAGQLTNSHNNSLRYQNSLSLIDPNPGNSMWSGIFNLSNLIFPFHSFIAGFTNEQCVNIPIIGSWLGSGSNTTYCSWWPDSIRSVLTPIFATASMMLLFGFIVAWLRNNGNGGLSSDDGKILFNNGGKK